MSHHYEEGTLEPHIDPQELLRKAQTRIRRLERKTRLLKKAVIRKLKRKKK